MGSHRHTKMISYENAKNIINKNTELFNKHEEIPLDEAHLRVVNHNYRAKFDSPNFDISSMDGIVINSQDFKRKEFSIIGESKAGDTVSYKIKSDEAKFIFTGAPLPKGKNIQIIPIESCIISRKKVRVKENFIAKDFVRNKGSNFKKNDLCISKKDVLNIRSLSLASTLGISSIKVLSKPKVVIIISGDEIINQRNKSGLIFSSNTLTIKKFVQIFGGEVIKIVYVRDTMKDIEKEFKKIGKFDILISSGGISMGRYDLIKKFLIKKKVNILFNKVSIKPGKPTIFGKFKNNSYYLGIPGNPVSCFIVCLIFLSLIFKNLFGLKNSFIQFNKIENIQNINNKTNLTHFMRIKVLERNNKVHIKLNKKQDSSLQKVLNESDGILINKPSKLVNEKKSILEYIKFTDLKNYSV